MVFKAGFKEQLFSHGFGCCSEDRRGLVLQLFLSLAGSNAEWELEAFFKIFSRSTDFAQKRLWSEIGYKWQVDGGGGSCISEMAGQQQPGTANQKMPVYAASPIDFCGTINIAFKCFNVDCVVILQG